LIELIKFKLIDTDFYINFFLKSLIMEISITFTIVNIV